MDRAGENTTNSSVSMPPSIRRCSGMRCLQPQSSRIGQDLASCAPSATNQTTVRQSAPRWLLNLHSHSRRPRAPNPRSAPHFIRWGGQEAGPPRNIFPKPHQPGKWRLIVDLSSPHGHSVNDAIEADFCHMHYSSVLEAAELIRQLGPGTLLAKVDLHQAYRILPVHADDPA